MHPEAYVICLYMQFLIYNLLLFPKSLQLYNYVLRIFGMFMFFRSKLTALSAETCPYKIRAGWWINDCTKRTGIEWTDVSYYLIETPGVFTRVHAKESMRVSRLTTNSSLAG